MPAKSVELAARLDRIVRNLAEAGEDAIRDALELNPELAKQLREMLAEPVHPNEGGCWFCHKTYPQRDLVICCEFDTLVHVKCARKAYLECTGTDGQEAVLIWNEIGPKPEPDPTIVAGGDPA